MILFKSFVEAIYQAISEATDVLCEKNRQILDKYFYEYPNDDNGISEEKTLHPKTISLDYPVLNDEGTVVKCNIYFSCAHYCYPNRKGNVYCRISTFY